MKWRVTIKEGKPSDCINCPLKPSYTRDCGKVESTRPAAGACTYTKLPDQRCKIRQYQ